MAIKTTYRLVNNGLKALERCGEVVTDDRDVNRRMTATVNDAKQANKDFLREIERVQALYSETVKGPDGKVVDLRIKPQLQAKCNAHINWVAETEFRIRGKSLEYDDAVNKYKITPNEGAALLGWFLKEIKDEDEGYKTPDLSDGFVFDGAESDDPFVPAPLVNGGMKPSLIVPANPSKFSASEEGDINAE